MSAPVSNVSKWSHEETCDWFKSFGFEESEENKLFEYLRRYKVNASHILEMNLSFIEDLCGSSDIFNGKVFQIKVKELRLRDDEEKRVV